MTWMNPSRAARAVGARRAAGCSMRRRMPAAGGPDPAGLPRAPAGSRVVVSTRAVLHALAEPAVPADGTALRDRDRGSRRDGDDDQVASRGLMRGRAMLAGPMSDLVDRTFDPRDGPLAKTARGALADSER